MKSTEVSFNPCLLFVKEAHTSIVVSRTEDDSSKVNQLRVDDVACHVMPGDYEICIHVTD